MSNDAQQFNRFACGFFLPCINAAAGAAAGGLGGYILNREYGEAYDPLVTTKMGAAGGAFLSMATLASVAVGTFLAACCELSVGDDEESKAGCLLMILNLGFIALSGQVGYSWVNHDDSNIERDQALAATGTGAGIGILLGTFLTAVACLSAGRVSLSCLSYMNTACQKSQKAKEVSSIDNIPIAVAVKK